MKYIITLFVLFASLNLYSQNNWSTTNPRPAYKTSFEVETPKQFIHYAVLWSGDTIELALGDFKDCGQPQRPMSNFLKKKNPINDSQGLIITEDVIMNHDTLKYRRPEHVISHSPFTTTLELRPMSNLIFTDNMPTYGPKLAQESQIEELQLEVDELKSQVKELSILVKDLIEKIK